MRLKETTRTAWSRGTSAHAPGGQLGTAGTGRRYGTASAGTNQHVECFRMGNIEHCTGSWAPALFESERKWLEAKYDKTNILLFRLTNYHRGFACERSIFNYILFLQDNCFPHVGP